MYIHNVNLWTWNKSSDNIQYTLSHTSLVYPWRYPLQQKIRISLTFQQTEPFHAVLESKKYRYQTIKLQNPKDKTITWNKETQIKGQPEVKSGDPEG